MRRGERPNVGNTMRPAGQRSATGDPADWVTEDRVPGAHCAHCERAIWQELGRWVHCDTGSYRCVVTYAHPAAARPADPDQDGGGVA